MKAVAITQEKEMTIMDLPEPMIGPGDVLDISVWKEEALTKLVTVLPDGNMSFPLIGQVFAGGKTLAQLRAELEKILRSGRLGNDCRHGSLGAGKPNFDRRWIGCVAKKAETRHQSLGPGQRD